MLIVVGVCGQLSDYCEYFEDDRSVAVPGDCRGFFKCESGEAVYEKCPDQQFFYEMDQKCDTPKPSCKDYFCIGVEDGLFVDHPRNPQKYYRCENERAERGICPDSTYFLKDQQVCAEDDYKDDDDEKEEDDVED